MNLKDIKIKTKLLILGGLTIFFLLLLAVMLYNADRQIEGFNDLNEGFSNLDIITLKIRKSEKDFQLRSLFDPQFFKNKESKYIKKVDSYLEEADEIIEELISNEMLEETNLNKDLKQAKDYFEIYDNTFHKLVTVYYDKGFEEYGEIGKIQKAISEIEESCTEKSISQKLLELRVYEKRYMLKHSEKNIERVNNTISEVINEVEKNTELIDLEKKNYKSALKKYRNSFAAVVELNTQIGITEKEGLQGEFRNAIHQLEPMVGKMRDEIDHYSEQNLSSIENQLVITILLLIFFLTITISYIIRNINASLLQTQEAVRTFAQGDFSKEIHIQSKDELGMLLTDIKGLQNSMRESVLFTKKVAEGDLTKSIKPRSDKDDLVIALSRMISHLNQIISKIVESSNNVASSSSQLSSTSSIIAQGANEQAASTEEISSSIEQMSSTIQQNNDNALHAEKIAGKASQGFIELKSATDKIINAIKEVVNKIDIINEIAGKTDILAINAAIEAARAGDHGKGFAVVASEIRTLAEVSQKAAKEINELSEGNLLVTEEAGRIIEALLPNIEKTTQMVQEIAAASNEQSVGASQISQSVVQFSQVVQQNSAAAEEMSSSSEELAHQAEALKEAISFFKIKSHKTITESFSKKQQPDQPIAEDTPDDGVSIELYDDSSNGDFEKYKDN